MSDAVVVWLLIAVTAVCAVASYRVDTRRERLQERPKHHTGRRARRPEPLRVVPSRTEPAPEPERVAARRPFMIQTDTFDSLPRPFVVGVGRAA